jgi:CelD/BcsL family acetyltransferase involved in cellulose biosynthesis
VAEVTDRLATLQVERLPIAGPALADWGRLQYHGAVPTPFLSQQWYAAMAGVAALVESAEVLVCRRAGAVVGLLPIEIVNSGGLRTLGVAGSQWSCPDHLDVVAVPEDRHSVAGAIARHLAERRDWDLLDLAVMAGDSPLPTALRSTMHRPRFVVRADQSMPIMTAQVTEGGPTLGKWARRRLRQVQSIVDNHCGTVELVSDPQRVPELLDDLMMLHQQRFGDRSVVFATAERRQFHRAVARTLSETRQAHIARLTVGGVDAALLYILTWRSTAYLYCSGLRPSVLQSAGTALRDWILCNGVEDCDTIDFLRGEQEWKALRGDTVLNDTRVRVARATPRVAAEAVKRLWDSDRSEAQLS